MRIAAIVTAIAFFAASTTLAQQSTGTEVVAGPPAEAAPQDCRKINKGGPIAGIVVGAVFWPLLPLSIPLLVTQSKKLKRRNAEIYEQSRRGCPPQ